MKIIKLISVFASYFCFISNLYAQELNVPKYVSPVKTSDPKYARNSVTILTAEDLHDLGVDNTVDAMRLVPGMVVTELHGARVSVDYHGGNSYRTRRSQVLFNSQKINRPFDQNVLWNRMPIDTRDVAYIEVIRGTSVVDFGSNSFLSSINLVQDPVALKPDLHIATDYEDPDNYELRLSFSADLGNSINNFRIFRKESSAFETSNQSDDLLDDYIGDSFLWNGELETNSGLLDWSFIVSNYDYDFPTINRLDNDDPDASIEISSLSYPEKANTKTTRLAVKHAGTSLDHNFDWNYGVMLSKFNRKQQVQLCLPEFLFDPALAELDASDNISLVSSDFNLLLTSSLLTGTGQLNESVLSPLTAYQQNLLSEFGARVQVNGLAAVANEICGTANQDFLVQGGNVTAGLKFYLNDKTELATNFLIDNSSVESDTFFDGTHRRTVFEWGNEFTYIHSVKSSSHFGTLTEYNSDIDDFFTSSRYALNYRINPENAVRFKIAKSYRLPSPFETNRIQQFYVDYLNNQADYNGNTSADSLRVTKSPSLEPEKIISKELEFSHSNKIGSNFSFKLFDENRYNLISEPTSYIINDISNDGQSDVKGYEFGFRQEVDSLNQLILGGSYARIDVDTNTPEEDTLNADWLGSAWFILPLSSSSKIGVVHYFNDEIAGIDYKRTDINITNSFSRNNSDINISLNYRKYPKMESSFTQFSSTDPYIVERKDEESISLRLSVDIN